MLKKAAFRFFTKCGLIVASQMMVFFYRGYGITIKIPGICGIYSEFGLE
jgi:hypothetical protein